MKNAQEVKNKLAKFQEGNRIKMLLDKFPGIKKIAIAERETIFNVSLLFVNKLIKHLNSKTVSKGTVSNVIIGSWRNLQNFGVGSEGLDCFGKIAAEIVNVSFEGAFSNRLNVKSQEFMDLPDWDPSDK